MRVFGIVHLFAEWFGVYRGCAPQVHIDATPKSCWSHFVNTSSLIGMAIREIESISITPEIEQATKQAIEAALVYQKAANRKLGITGEVGEVLVCKILKLRLATSNLEKGIDAVLDGRTYQIKARRPEKGERLKGSSKLSKFSTHKYDVALLAILSSSYEVLEIWSAEYDRIEPIVHKQKRRNPSVGQFKSVAERVYPR